MTLYLQLLSNVQRVCYDDPPPADPPPADPPAADTVTRAEFDTHMGGLRKKYEARESELKTAQRELANQLTEARKAKGLSEEERGEYDERIVQLEGSFLSEKEKLERKTNHQKTEYESQIQELTAARDGATSSYRNEVVRNQIYSASSEHDGHDPDQFDATISRWIKWEDNLVDGEPDGTTRPEVNFPDVDKDGTPVVMKYTIDECVKRMKEIPKHQNLFKPNLKPGLGGGPNAGAPGQIDARKLAKENPAEYRRLRKEQPELLYGSMGKK